MIKSLPAALAACLHIALLSPLVAADDCETVPEAAVTELPSPLSEWGEIVCSRWGYLIVAREGWIWTYPGSLAPVHIPAQMVQTDPSEIWSDGYFAR
ncbi:MAG: hypothetical protein AAGL49_11335, partial [Pseudomonadota bacterium]